MDALEERLTCEDLEQLLPVVQSTRLQLVDDEPQPVQPQVFFFAEAARLLGGAVLGGQLVGAAQCPLYSHQMLQITVS